MTVGPPAAAKGATHIHAAPPASAMAPGELLSCEEPPVDWEAALASPAAGRVARSPAPGPADEDDSEGEDCLSEDEQEEGDDFAHLEAALRCEAELLPDASYPGGLQPAVDAATREALVAWILAASRRHRFSFRTAVAAVSLLDRFLSRYVIQPSLRWLVQLSATACLSVAAKQEESTVPLLADLQVLCETRFEAKYIMKMELLVLSTLGWRVATSTSVTFLEHWLRRLRLRPRARRSLRAHARQVIRRTLPHAAFLAHSPSNLALASLHHALRAAAPSLRAFSTSSGGLLLTEGAHACLGALGVRLGPAWSDPGAPLSAPAKRAAALHAQAGAHAAMQAAAHRKGLWEDRESPTSTLAGCLFQELDLDAASDEELPNAAPPPLAAAAAAPAMRRRSLPPRAAAATAHARPLLPAKRAFGACHAPLRYRNHRKPSDAHAFPAAE